MCAPPCSVPSQRPHLKPGLTLRTLLSSSNTHDLAERLRIRGQLVARAPFGQRRESGLRAQHPGLHRVVRALDARHVEKARRIADQRAAGKGEFRNRLQAALADRARAVTDALAAFEGAADRRVRLEALEFIVRRQVRIRVVEVHHEADRDQLVVEVVHERAAAGPPDRAASPACGRPGPGGAARARPARAP